MKKLLIATTNKGKISEYREIFKELDISLELVTLKDLDINMDVEESGRTFEENAVLKAKFYFNLSSLPTLSDDAGLEIDYLNGEPGVHSRRWPGYRATDDELMNLALEKLKGVPEDKRGAQLRAVVGLSFPGEEKVYAFEGVLRGRIAQKPFRKTLAGYPFRSIFIPVDSDKYLGELHIVAHRKQAIEKALPIIKKYLC
jgi:XTP/dITP diphosphohydrolase